MSQPETNCNSCGAPISGLICGHCGKLTSRLNNAADENHALDEYHKLLQSRTPEEQRSWLLESGFLPDNREALIEAGIYCVPLLKKISLYDAAAARLEAIILKLKLMPHNEQTRRAVADFQSKIEQYKLDKRKDDVLGFGCLLLILAAIVAFGWWLIRDAGLSVAVPLIVVAVIVVVYLLFRK
ncbi:MAG TPA: hypothetical protein VEQ40_03120 [Pyrinomonadaceae bacterium]|nr:hypothetical protein [Pyrinomonadaceae bacterium]